MESASQDCLALEATGLVKQYRSGLSTIEVIKGISLAVRSREIVVIMGPSGVGKSTLLNLIGTLDRPTAGQLKIDGQLVSELSEPQLAAFRNRRIGFIFQFHYLMPEFTALENVMIPRMIRGENWKADQQRAVDLLTEVGLDHRLSHKPAELSGGEQQRVAIARALINRPGLVLADEPTGDLDRVTSRNLFNLILELNQKYGQTFVIVTHDEMFAEQAHRIIHLADGAIEDERVLKKVSAS